jgi:hypothetical protein
MYCQNRKIRVPAPFVEVNGAAFECSLKIYSFSATALRKTLSEGARELPLLWRHESIGLVHLFEGQDSDVRCVYHPVPSRLARDAAECIRGGCATGVELAFDLIKYRPGRIIEVRVRSVTFVRALAGVWPAARAETFSENIPGAQCLKP